MKIGIVTFWWSRDNYGQLLQLYALHTYLKRLGHEPFLIRYAPWKDVRKFGRSDLADLLRHPFKIFKYVSDRFVEHKVSEDNRKHDRRFEQFLTQNINYTESVYSAEELFASPPAADVYAAGSDQVWGARLPHPVYFLGFGGEHTRRIAFSASFGDSDIFFRRAYYSALRPHLERFDLITVREQGAAEICKHAGRGDAAVIPDPTLLVDKAEYDRLCDDRSTPSIRYCLVYLLEQESKTTVGIDDIAEFIKAKGMEMIYVSGQGRFDGYQKCYPTIPEFLSYIKNAEFVITNSFHGSVFSILFERRFAVIPKRGGRGERLNTLLGSYGLMDRLTVTGAQLERAYNYVADPVQMESVTRKNKDEAEKLLFGII